MKYLKYISIFLALPLIALIFVYQKTLSPDHGPLKFMFHGGACRYYPSCSEYGKQCLKKQGVVGLPKLIWRVFRCNPWSKGGYDPI